MLKYHFTVVLSTGETKSNWIFAANQMDFWSTMATIYATKWALKSIALDKVTD